jgi:hypothetical protein
MWGGMPDLQRFWSWPTHAGDVAVVAPMVSVQEAFDLALRDILFLRRLWSVKHAGMSVAADGPSLLTLGELGFAA